MPPAGFETAVPTSERPPIHALDLAATGNGKTYQLPPVYLVTNTWLYWPKVPAAVLYLFRNTNIDTVQWKLSGTPCPIYPRNRASGVGVNSTEGSTFWRREGLCILGELNPRLLVFSWFRLLSRSLPLVYKTQICSELLLKFPESSSG